MSEISKGCVALLYTIYNSLVAQNRQAELLEACWVGNHIDLGDLTVCDGEVEHEQQLPTRGHQDSYRAVHQNGSRSLGTSRELLGYGQRTSDLPRRAHRHGGSVVPEHHVGVEHGEQRAKITGTRGGQEGVDHFSLVGEIGVLSRRASPHPATRAARELACSGLRA